MKHLLFALTCAAVTPITIHPLTAAAGTIRPADTAAPIAIDVVAEGSVVCVYASAAVVAEGAGCTTDPALTNMDDVCPTAAGWCGFGSDIIIRGGQAADTLTVATSATTLATAAIKLKGRAGDDVLEVFSVAGGDVHLYGEQGDDRYVMGSVDNPIIVGEDARLTVNGATSDDSAGEIYAVHLATEGQVQITGTGQPDAIDISGVFFADNQNSRCTVKAKGGADTITAGPITIEGTGVYPDVRAVFSVLGGGGSDVVSLSGDMLIGVHASGLFQMGSGGDTIDLTGATVALDGYGGAQPTQSERQDSAYLSLSGNRGNDTLRGADTISVGGGATVNTNGWESEN